MWLWKREPENFCDHFRITESITPPEPCGAHHCYVGISKHDSKQECHVGSK